MAARKPKKQGTGVLIRGADGALYHIPGNKLKAYRLPDAFTHHVRAFMDARGLKAKKGKVPAFHAAGLVSAPQKAVLVQGKAVLTKGGKAVLVKGQKPVLTKGQKAVLVKGQKPVLTKGQKAVLVKGQKPVLLKSQKAVLVNLNKVKSLAKGK